MQNRINVWYLFLFIEMYASAPEGCQRHCFGGCWFISVYSNGKDSVIFVLNLFQLGLSSYGRCHIHTLKINLHFSNLLCAVINHRVLINTTYKEHLQMVCEQHFRIAFRVMDISDADKGLCADHPSANVFPKTAVGKLRGLSITDARQCKPAQKAW